MSSYQDFYCKKERRFTSGEALGRPGVGTGKVMAEARGTFPQGRTVSELQNVHRFPCQEVFMKHHHKRSLLSSRKDKACVCRAGALAVCAKPRQWGWKGAESGLWFVQEGLKEQAGRKAVVQGRKKSP